MDVFTLDGNYRRDTVVDKYESLIWTERYSSYGDFQLILPSSLENRKLFTAGLNLAIADSYRVMKVEAIEDSIDADGTKRLKLSGRSLESIMLDRLARDFLSDLTTNAKWTITGSPAWIATHMFDYICGAGSLATGDILSHVFLGSIFPPDTIPLPPDSIVWELDPKDLYTAEKELCDLYRLGFRLIRDHDESTILHFDVYSGSDRTTLQTTLPAVVFSTELDNLQNTKELTTTASYKNVAYVISPVGHQIVYADGVDSSISDFDRKVLFVKADDIKDTDSSVANARMIQRGNEELGKNRVLSAFDGELNQNSQYVYGKDYNLGDLVELQNEDTGGRSIMKVTEHIFVSDREGVRSYPTLMIDQFIMPGTWLSVPTDQVWTDRGTTDYWNTNP